MIYNLNNIASTIFKRYGVDFTTAKRAGGWTNATWLGGGLVLRLSQQPGVNKIRREARLAALLPPEAGYPAVLETGVSEGYEWCISQMIPGRNLGEVWPELDWEQRLAALRQLWAKAQAVHGVDLRTASALARERAWYNSTDPVESSAGIARLVQQKLLTSRQADALGAALERFWKALPAAGCVLNHGDLTLDNALWQDGQVVSLLDFEFAVIAPVELDLNSLVKNAFAPPGLDSSLPDPIGKGLQRLRKGVAGLASSVLSRPNSRELLTGYAILLELWMLQDWLAHPEGEGPLEHWQPYRRLLSLADGRGGYLAEI